MKHSHHPAPEFRELLVDNLRGICGLSDAQITLLESHYNALRHWNEKMNLTAIRDAETIVIRHYCESLFLGTVLPEGSLAVADIGSGAGFPGVPLVVIRPGYRMTLVESNTRKAVFLRESTRGWANVAVEARRAEDIEGRYDLLVSRAVATKDVMRLVPSLAPAVALLVGSEDEAKLLKIKNIKWDEPVPLPWGERRVVVLGHSVSCDFRPV